MQAPAAAPDFLDLLEKSGLLSSAQISRFAEKAGITDDDSAEESARRLVREKVLTPFQAERLLEGRYRGLVIDRYRVREVLGFGGMGCVFIAEDPQEQTKVALKVLSAEHTLDAGMLARMKLEAAAGMCLKHPNIIQTYRIGSTGAVHFLVMELVRGISLHELVALQGPMHWSAACDVGMQAARALHAAHSKGIVHRDIKPANFLIDNAGVARILDFGLALMDNVEDDEFSLSMLFGHDCLGTPDYIAPEQSIDSRHVDGRADIYSLGAALYVAMTARLPFPEKTNKLKLEAQRNRVPRTVCEIKPDIPPAVGAIIARMMEKDPAKRFQSAAEVHAALKEHAKRQPVTFDFRELVTLRAKQARAKAENTAKKSATNQRSSITSASGWLRNQEHQFSETTNTFARGETPAVRQIVPDPIRGDSSAGHRPRSTSSRAANAAAPSGWRIQMTGQKHWLPLTRSRNAVGSKPSAEIVVEGVDEIQCWIEFDGTSWQLKQQSMSHPTYLNGSVSSFGVLQHGSVLTFGGKAGFRLINIAMEEARQQRKVIAITVAVVVAVVSGLLAFIFR